MNETSSYEPGHASRSAIALAGFAAIVGILLFTEHRAHVLGVLPYAILLLCPLFHVFHHGGHSGHEIHAEHDARHEGHGRAGGGS